MIPQMKCSGFSKQAIKYAKNIAIFSQYGIYDFENNIIKQEVTAQCNAFVAEPKMLYTNTQICQPFLYADNGIINIGGVTKYDPTTQTGNFSLVTSNGVLNIKNVHSYHVFGHLHPKNLVVFSFIFLPEYNELSDVYVSAIVRDKNTYNYRVYKNTDLIFSMDNVFPTEFVDYGDMGPFHLHIPYIRFSQLSDNGIYKNFAYCLRDFKLYILDDSISIPSFYIDYREYKTDWSRFSNTITLPNHGINIYLHLNSGKTSQIISEFIKDADVIEVINNAFPDDATVNLRVTYIDRPLDVRFIYYCASLDTTILGTGIMDIPLDELEKGTLNYRYECRYMLDSKSANIEYYKKINRELYLRCQETMKINQLPDSILQNYISHREMVIYIYAYLRDNYQGKYSVNYINSRYNSDNVANYEEEKKRYTTIFQKIASEEKLTSRWVNEYHLFKVVKKKYTDAIYQYHCSWLGRQSLDIYIPSLKTGIEYQGRQHFEPITFFGGTTAFEQRVILDKRKRDLCLSNGVTLLEWKYNEPISTSLLKSKISNSMKETM